MKFSLNSGSSKLVLLALGSLGLILVFSLSLRPTGGQAQETTFVVEPGQGFGEIARDLRENGLIRSTYSFEITALLEGKANKLKPGTYTIKGTESTTDILSKLVKGPDQDIEVSIIEGDSKFDIDALLAEKGILKKGGFLSYLSTLESDPEGMLFPDTYRFFPNSTPKEVLDKMLANFDKKALPLLSAEPKKLKENLALASIVEKEAPDYEDRRIVAGILKKRLGSAMPLQADATLCYAKESEKKNSVPCYPITLTDMHKDSPYNTYTNRGLPRGPIGNPGLEAIKATLDSKSSPYWYYLSDPKTKKTIFSVTLDEHLLNTKRYLAN